MICEEYLTVFFINDLIALMEMKHVQTMEYYIGLC